MGTLQVVATPIGNLEDVTLRALRALAEADLVFAEDTRRTRILLDRHGVSARPVSLHAHNEEKRIGQALERLREGGTVAVVSDAGTPVVSDPGARLVAAAAADGHAVEPVPGASAVLAALAASGLRTATFTFLGFPPRRAGARRKLFATHAGGAAALVLFESPHRLAATLADLAATLGGERRACVARELTKQHEEIARGSLDELAARFAGPVRGEITLVIEGRDRAAAATGEGEALDEAAIDLLIDELAAEGRRAKEIAALVAERTGLARRDVYARAVAVLEERAAAAEAEPDDAEATSS